MTSADIRNLVLEDDSTIHLLKEIAAQLAEMNEASKPRLVELTHKGRPFAVLLKDVSAVGYTSEAGKVYVAVCGRPYTCDQSYEEVIKALGFEVRL